MFYENLEKCASPKLLKTGRLDLSCREHKGEVDKNQGGDFLRTSGYFNVSLPTPACPLCCSMILKKMLSII